MAAPHTSGGSVTRVLASAARRLCCSLKSQCHITVQPVVVGKQRQVVFHALVPGGIGTPLGDAVAVRLVGDLLPDLREVLRTMGMLEMREPLRPLAPQMPPAPKQVAGARIAAGET